jgi:hypothetical protein
VGVSRDRDSVSRDRDRGGGSWLMCAAYGIGLAWGSLFTFDTWPLVTWPTVDTGDMDLRS